MKQDRRLALGYGSAWHLLRFLGYHRDELNRRICELTAADGVRWLDFPFRDRYDTAYPTGAPVLDTEWTRLNFLACESARSEYPWPNRGEQQNWDAVGQLTFLSQQEWLLVEAKAHLGEVKRDGCKNRSRNKIAKLFHKAACAFDAKHAEPWEDCFYQVANRLYTLYFLNTNGHPARLLFVWFTGDMQSNAPASEAEWMPVIEEVQSRLGWTPSCDLAKRVHHLFLPISPR